MAKAAGSELREALGELDCGRVREPCEHHVLQRSELLYQRRIDARVAVPKQIDPPRADRIEDAAAFEIVEPDPFGAADRHERQRFVVFHLRAGMPDRAQAALEHPCVRVHAVASSKDASDRSQAAFAALGARLNGSTPTSG